MTPLLRKLVNALGYKRLFHLDFETFSEIDIKDGVRAYSTHPSTEVLLAAYAYENDDPVLYDAAETPRNQSKRRRAIENACKDPDVLLCAWNVPFEREILRHVWGIETPPEKWVDAMAVAYTLSLPGKLGEASAVLKLDAKHAKDPIGKKLIQTFSKPQPANRKIRRRDWTTDPEQWAQFGEYCRRDVIAERACLNRMARFLPPVHEFELWHLDQRINERGMPIDLDLVSAAQEVADDLKAELKRQCAVLTGLDNPNSRDQFLPWIQEHGYPYSSLKADKVEIALASGEVDSTGVAALKLRSQFSKNSVAKFAKIESQTVDGFLCYTLQYAAAGRTWRWGGRGAQFQNLPRPLKELEPPEAMEQAVEIVKRRDPGMLLDFFEEPVNVLASVVRPTARAKPGHVLHVADLSAVENRGLGWLARCEPILDVFRHGLDPYKDFALKMYHNYYGRPGDAEYAKLYEAVTKAERTGSKPAVLGAGYRLGGGQLKKDKETGEESKTGLWGYAESLGVALSREDAARSVQIFRDTYVEVVEFWYALENAAWDVIENRGRKTVRVPVGFSGQYLEFGYQKPAMYIKLPSGRCLWYVRPQIKMCNMPWDDKETGKPARRLGITYEGLNQQTGRWHRQTTHGGKLTENVCQAICRDILGHGMHNAERAGYTPVLHVHDELVCHDRVDTGLTVEGLEQALCDLPEWCLDLPMGAAGYESPFYMKD